MLQGALFTRDFLLKGVQETLAWKERDEERIAAQKEDMRGLFDSFVRLKNPNEAETEEKLIYPVLKTLGWDHYFVQQNMSFKGRADVPDALLFADEEAKARAAPEEGWKRFQHGACIVEAKRWGRILDREDKREQGVPSTQILRYLKRASENTNHALRWGILTNGRLWRLYFDGALSVAEDYLEIDMGKVLGLEGCDLDILDQGLKRDADKGDEDLRDHVFDLFILLFARDAFVPRERGMTLHQIAREQGKLWEERVAEDLSKVVFGRIYPMLVGELAARDPARDPALGEAYLETVRQGALILLYRLLFVLYAEDRNLLPDEDGPYKEYALTRIRLEVAEKRGKAPYSERATLLWSRLSTVFTAIANGDDSLGIPPYNGGLFEESEQSQILYRVQLPDAVVAEIVFGLSHAESERGPRYINYRDLSVQQLGSIYERLLEHRVVADGDKLSIQLNTFARKDSGSYYTPDGLVTLVIEKAVGPLIEERMQAFRRQAALLSNRSAMTADERKKLEDLDPACRILDLKICDPAMGSGHFLVNLVDWLADRVLEAMAEAATLLPEPEAYKSPLAERIEAVREKILANAREHKWPDVDKHLNDKNIVRRMILKRCIYGVDLNPMAVELTKVALWLHSFTVGAPLSFLDHHLRKGDALFGENVLKTLRELEKKGGIFLLEPIRKAEASISSMELIEDLTDAEISEVEASSKAFQDVSERTRPLVRMLNFWQALRWLDLSDEEQRAVDEFLGGVFGDPVEIALGKAPELNAAQAAKQDATQRAAAETRLNVFRRLLERAEVFAQERRFLHWQVAFPGVWKNWQSNEPKGGFDAVIGNPPWDRLKFQEVEWFAARKPEIALSQRAADRKKKIAALKAAGDPLALAYERAATQAEKAARLARSSGEYPLLSGGDTNIYSLFVERASNLVKEKGIVGLLTPSGIASDKTAAPFFRSISTTGRLANFYDFENRKGFFPDVDSRFKFCAITFGGKERRFPSAECAFFLHSVAELQEADRAFALSAEDFSRVNPNTGTAPIFRTRRDAELTKAIYERLPVLVDRSKGEPVFAYPVRYFTMFHMTNDSHLFVTRAELEETAYPVGGNRWRRGEEEFVPLYVGRMIHQYDHRASSVSVNEENIHNPAGSANVTSEQKEDPRFYTEPQFWIESTNVNRTSSRDYALSFRDIARSTDARTLIACFIPSYCAGNTLPLIDCTSSISLVEIVFWMNAISTDFTVRQKVQSTHVNWYIVEQLPIIPTSAYSRPFGKKKAAEIVREEVLALTYTAHDMAPFARDMGYVDPASGEVKPPFVWDARDRLRRRAKLDALAFMLTFPSESAEDIKALRETASYIYSTFPIVEREETEAYGRYLSRDLCLASINALAAGDPDAVISLER